MQLHYLLLQVKQRAHILNLRINHIRRQREIGIPHLLLNTGIEFINQRLNDLIIVFGNSTEFAEAALKQKVRYSLLRINAVCYIGAENAAPASFMIQRSTFVAGISLILKVSSFPRSLSVTVISFLMR